MPVLTMPTLILRRGTGVGAVAVAARLWAAGAPAAVPAGAWAAGGCAGAGLAAGAEQAMRVARRMLSARAALACRIGRTVLSPLRGRGSAVLVAGRHERVGCSDGDDRGVADEDAAGELTHGLFPLAWRLARARRLNFSMTSAGMRSWRPP